MEGLSSNDLRQLTLLQEMLDQFESNKISLYKLVSNLNGIFNMLELQNEPWKNEVQALINTLELVHDCIEDGSIAKWSERPQDVIQDMILQLKGKSNFLLENYLKVPDLNIKEKGIALDSSWLMCPKCNEVWESRSTDAMVLCPKCKHVFHNPAYVKMDSR